MSDHGKKCAGADCSNEAGTLQCPTCLKLGVKGSFFCAQDCFKRNWVSCMQGSLLNKILTLIASRPHTRRSTKHRMVNTRPRWQVPLNWNFESDRDTASGFYNPFPQYPFTGSVRPVYPLSPRRPVPKSIKHPDWAETGIPKREMRLSRSKIDILDTEGQEAMRKVCRLSREVLDITAAAMKPGVTTDYLDEICHNACVERNVS